MERFFGGNPIAVILKLIVMSIVVGIVLAAFGLSPLDLIDRMIRLVERIYAQGFQAIEWLWQYFVVGAVIVVPIWFISRLMKSSKSTDRH